MLGLQVIDFFSNYNKSKKTFYQLGSFSNHYFSYYKVQYLVNTIVVKNLLRNILCHLFRYKIITTN